MAQSAAGDVPVLGLLRALHGPLCPPCFEENVNNAVSAALIYRRIQENIGNSALPLRFAAAVATCKGTDGQIVICKAGRGEKHEACLPACLLPKGFFSLKNEKKLKKGKEKGAKTLFNSNEA